MKLTLPVLRKEAKFFCKNERFKEYSDLLGVTGAYRIETYVEHKYMILLPNIVKKVFIFLIMIFQSKSLKVTVFNYIKCFTMEIAI